AAGHLRQQGQRNDGRRNTDARFGQREGAGRSGDRNVAGADETKPSCADVSVDGGDHRHRQLEDPAQQARQFAGPVDGDIAGVTPRSLSEIRSCAERSAGVVEHDGPDPGFFGGVSEALVQLVDQRGGQGIAVVRRIQREPGDAALDGVVNECGHQYERGRPREVCATKLSTISRLTGAMRASFDAVTAAAMPYSLVSPLPPSDWTAWSTARTDASAAAYLAMFAASAAPVSS